MVSSKRIRRLVTTDAASAPKPPGSLEAPKPPASLEVGGVELAIVCEGVPVVTLKKGTLFEQNASWLLQIAMDSGSKANSLWNPTDMEKNIKSECLCRGIVQDENRLCIGAAKGRPECVAVGTSGKRSMMIGLVVSLALCSGNTERYETTKLRPPLERLVTEAKRLRAAEHSKLADTSLECATVNESGNTSQRATAALREAGKRLRRDSNDECSSVKKRYKLQEAAEAKDELTRLQEAPEAAKEPKDEKDVPLAELHTRLKKLKERKRPEIPSCVSAHVSAPSRLSPPRATTSPVSSSRLDPGTTTLRKMRPDTKLCPWSTYLRHRKTPELPSVETLQQLLPASGHWSRM